MEELIQVMKILSKDEVNKINKYVDTLDFNKIPSIENFPLNPKSYSKLEY